MITVYNNNQAFGKYQVIDSKTDTSSLKLEVFLDGEMKILSADFWESQRWEEVRMLMHETGTYVLPTEELIDYLDTLIGDKSTIEICAGNGYIGRELGIPITDSRQQQDDVETKLSYQLAGQPCIRYPHDVIKMEANVAVEHFRPHTVIGCFATHKWRHDKQSGNYKGVEFSKLIRKVKRLVLVGHLEIHADNPLMDLPHEEIYLPGLITRAANQKLNRIFIWNV